MKIAIISDLHFFDNSFCLKDLCSNAWIGKVTATFLRHNLHKKDVVEDLFKFLDLLAVDLFIVAGDLSTVASVEEFFAVKNFLADRLGNCLFVPGNHDCYTKHASHAKRFYDFFSNASSGLSLAKDRVEYGELTAHWDYILLDTAICSPSFLSYGRFSQQMEKNLLKVLKKAPTKNIIVVNHFPLKDVIFTRSLRRRKVLADIIKNDERLKLYVCGHTHCAESIDMGSFELLNCASSSHCKEGGCIVITLDEERYRREFYAYRDNCWQKTADILKGS